MKNRITNAIKNISRIILIYSGLGFAIFFFYFLIIEFSLPAYVGLFESLKIKFPGGISFIDLLLLFLIGAMYFSIGEILEKISKRKLLHSLVFAFLATWFLWDYDTWLNYQPVAGYFIHEIMPLYTDINEAFVITSKDIILICTAHLLELAFIAAFVYAGAVSARFLQKPRIRRVLEIMGFSVWLLAFVWAWVAIGSTYVLIEAFPKGMFICLSPVIVMAIIRLYMLMRKIPRKKIGLGHKQINPKIQPG